MANEGRLKIGGNFLKIGANYLRIGPVSPYRFYAAVVTSGGAVKIVRYLGSSAWELVSTPTEFLNTDSGFASYIVRLGNTHWAVRGVTGTNFFALLSSDNAVTWTVRIATSNSYYPVARDAGGRLWRCFEDLVGGNDRIDYSDDNGETWVQSYSDSAVNPWFPGIACHPSNQDIIAALGYDSDAETGLSVFFTTDRGANWQTIELPDPFNPGGQFSLGGASEQLGILFTTTGRLLVLHPVDDTVSLTNCSLVCFKTDDYSNVSWSIVADSNDLSVYAGDFPVALALSNDSTKLFALANELIAPALTNHEGKVYMSADNGETWTLLAIPFSAQECDAIFYDADADVLYACANDVGAVVFKAMATPSGAGTWADVTGDLATVLGDTCRAYGQMGIWT